MKFISILCIWMGVALGNDVIAQKKPKGIEQTVIDTSLNVNVDKDHHWLKTLKINDTLLIIRHTNSSWIRREEKLIFYKNKDGIEAILYKSINREAETDAQLLSDQIQKLTLDDILAFAQFEKELKQLKKGKCSTMVSYVITGPNINYSQTDATCFWRGYQKLVSKIFGNAFK